MYSDGRDSKSSPCACVCCRAMYVFVDCCCFFTLHSTRRKNNRVTNTRTHRQTLSSDCNRNVYISHACWLLLLLFSLVHVLIEFNYCTWASFFSFCGFLLFWLVFFFLKFWTFHKHFNFVMFGNFLAMESICFVYFFIFLRKGVAKEEKRNKMIRKHLLLEILDFGRWVWM